MDLTSTLKIEHKNNNLYLDKRIKEKEKELNELNELKKILEMESNREIPYIQGEIEQSDQNDLFKDMMSKNLLSNYHLSQISEYMKSIQNVFYVYGNNKAKLPDWFSKKYKTKIQNAYLNKSHWDSVNRIQAIYSSI